MGGLFDWLGKLVTSNAEHRTQIRIAPDHVLNGTVTGVTPVAKTHYGRIWLTEMFLRGA